MHHLNKIKKIVLEGEPYCDVPYQQLIGSVKEHWLASKRLLKYLKVTKDIRIVL